VLKEKGKQEFDKFDKYSLDDTIHDIRDDISIRSSNVKLNINKFAI
jgi:hypothetical protein